jgi:uncharacterized protein involved in oxidation of intracellular sulfur
MPLSQESSVVSDSKKHVVLLLVKSPEMTQFFLVIRMAMAFLSTGARVTLFLMDDAVLGLLPRNYRDPGSFPLSSVLSSGGEILVCQSTAEPRGLLSENLPPGVCFETQVHLGQLSSEADVFLPFL